jgi:DNA-binding NarL/FixJ family response regulator
LPPTVVLLADLAPMLEDTMSSVLKERSDLRVIRGATNNREFVNAAVAAGASVVVVARRNPIDLQSIDPYLANAANVSMLALALDGTSACLHAFKPTGQRLEDVSAEQILTAIAGVTPMGRA